MQWKNSRAIFNYKGVVALTTVSAFSKIASVLFKIIIIYIIGTIGIGYYQLAFPLFVFSYTLSSVGNSTALTMFVASGNEVKNRRVIRYAVAFSILIAGIIATFIVIFSKQIALLQGNENLYIIYFGVALTIISVSVLSVFRGAVRGYRLITKYAVSDFIEQITKLILAVLFSYILLPYGLIYAVLGVFLGIFCSAIIASFYTIAVINNHEKKYTEQTSNFDTKKFWIFAILASITSIILPLTQFIDSTLIVRLLEYIGYSHISATKLFGLSRGAVSSLINLPNSAFLAIDVLLLPDLVKLNPDEFADKSKKIITITTFLVSLFCVTFLLFSNEILALVYGAKLDSTEFDLSCTLLKIGSLGIFFAGLSQIQSTILQGKKMLYLPIISLVVASVSKLLFEILIIPKLGIIGVELSNVLFYIILSLLNSIFMCIKGMQFGSIKNLISILIGSGVVVGIRLLYSLYAIKFNYIIAIIFAFLTILVLIFTIYVSIIAVKKIKTNNNLKHWIILR